MRTKRISVLQKMFVKIVAKLILERAVMSGICIFTGSPVYKVNEIY